jgi:hypothetical protein
MLDSSNPFEVFDEAKRLLLDLPMSDEERREHEAALGHQIVEDTCEKHGGVHVSALLPAMRACEQNCGREATSYAIDPTPGGWGGFYCEPCREKLGFQVVDRIPAQNSEFGYMATFWQQP